MLKKEAEDLRNAWTCALRDVAHHLGYRSNHRGDSSHPVVRVLGPLAWSRFPYEPCAADGSKDRAVRGVGYLEGVHATALRTARELGDLHAEQLLAEIPRRVRGRIHG